MQDYEDYVEVITQLEKMGYTIGMLVEDFLVRSNIRRCAALHETGEEDVAKVHRAF